MPVWRTLLALVACASVGLGAELETVKGKKIQGDFVRLDDKEVVLQGKDGEVVLPATEVLGINFGHEAKLPSGVAYTDVELNDGTVFHCSKFRLVKDKVAMELLTGQTLELPLAVVANVLNNAHVEKNRTEWKARLKRKRIRDVLVREDEGGIEGTLGEGDAEGKTIEFTVVIGERKLSRRFEIAKLQGLIFTRGVDPKMAPVVCRVVDAGKNEVLASSLKGSGKELAVTTPSGAKLTYAIDKVALLDYSKGKVTYLTDLDPSDRVIKTAFNDFPPRRDKNIYGEPMKLAGVPYSRGWAMRAHTELEFDLGGDYREFRTVAGIDDSRTKLYEDKQPVILRVMGDGRELFRQEFTPERDKRVATVVLNVKNVQKLRLIVTAPAASKYPVGKNLNLADAKVTK
jgi:hypothetical protein